MIVQHAFLSSDPITSLFGYSQRGGITNHCDLVEFLRDWVAKVLPSIKALFNGAPCDALLTEGFSQGNHLLQHVAEGGMGNIEAKGYKGWERAH